MAGPATKPTPNAAPSSPISRARSRGAATSATAAWATDTLAPDAPSMMRPTNSRASHRHPPATPVSRLPTAVPNSEISSTGLRPMRSDSRPHSGAHSSWASENEATSTPMVVADGPELLGVLRQDRQHDPEADQVDGDRGPDGAEALGQGLSLLRSTTGARGKRT